MGDRCFACLGTGKYVDRWAADNADMETDETCEDCGGTGEGDYSAPNLGECAYYKRWKRLPGHDHAAECSFGCIDEPKCVTCEPEGGWV